MYNVMYIYMYMYVCCNTVVQHSMVVYVYGLTAPAIIRGI